MYQLSVKSEFSSAHSLREYKGKCEELHGHNWKVEAIVYASRTGKNGIVVDFHDIKGALKDVLREMDHKHLNELEYFKKSNPTSENIARHIFDKINARIAACACKLKAVTVWESDDCSATYSKR